MDTRTGGGKQAQKERRDIAVDVREFRSSLPSILHQEGMRLAPVTLTVGDFVVSD
jgi:DNA excision repair protein ERCC-4